VAGQAPIGRRERRWLQLSSCAARSSGQAQAGATGSFWCAHAHSTELCKHLKKVHGIPLAARAGGGILVSDGRKPGWCRMARMLTEGAKKIPRLTSLPSTKLLREGCKKRTRCAILRFSAEAPSQEASANLRADSAAIWQASAGRRGAMSSRGHLKRKAATETLSR
jgi:hypothetical protein